MPITSLTSFFNTTSFGDQNTYTRNQEELFLILDSAAHEFSNWKSLLSMSAGGAGYESGRLIARLLLGTTPFLGALPVLAPAFTFLMGAVSDTGLTRVIHHFLKNGGEENESFVDQLMNQGGVRGMGVLGLGQSFMVGQLLMGLASVSREMLFSRGDRPVAPTFLNSLLLGLQCHFGSGMFAGLTRGVVGAVEQRISLKTRNMNVVAQHAPEAHQPLAGGSPLQNFGQPVAAGLGIFSPPQAQGAQTSYMVSTSPEIKGVAWGTRRVSTCYGQFEVIGEGSYPPKKLVETLYQEPWMELGERKVFELTGDPHHRKVITREYEDDVAARSALDCLKAAFERGLPVEAPLALIVNQTGGTGRVTLLSLWKEGVRDMKDYLLDPAIPEEQKILACQEALVQLRTFHSAGFIHGDPRSRNVMRDLSGVISFVDLEYLQACRVKEVQEAEIEKLLHSLATSLLVSQVRTGKESPFEMEDLYARIEDKKFRRRELEAHIRLIQREAA